MLTLAIETSGTVGSIALCAEGKCLEERTLQLGRQHGQTLIPEIRQLLSAHGRSPRDCGLVAVSIGPGSFTGLRVGVVCAKTFAYATGCLVSGVDTLAAIACNSPADVAEVYVLSDAQRGDVFVNRFARMDEKNWTAATPIQIVSAENWAATLPADTVLSGPGLEKFADVFRNRCRVLPEECWQPHAAQIARLGEQRINSGLHDAPWTLEPLYLRKSSAEEKWELRQKTGST